MVIRRLKTFLSVLMAAVPLSVFAWIPGQRLVPECNTKFNAKGEFSDPCNWGVLMDLANNILSAIVWFAVPLAAVAFAYAGWLYLSAFGNPGKASQARSIFSNVGIGLVIVLGAWALVHFILSPEAGLVREGGIIEVLKNKK